MPIRSGEHMVLGTITGVVASDVVYAHFGTVIMSSPLWGCLYVASAFTPACSYLILADASLNREDKEQKHVGGVFSAIAGGINIFIINNIARSWVAWPLIQTSQTLATQILIGSGATIAPVAVGYGIYKIIEHRATIGQALTSCASGIKNAINGCASNIATRWNFWRNGEQAAPLLRVQAPPPPIQINIMQP